jgi:4-alpha-glucanotransferase
MLDERTAGILLPVFSLASPYGIGNFGKAAYDWVDWLGAARQRYWQVLPLGPTGWGDSPYQSFSAFALSPYYIDLDELWEEGLLLKEDCTAIDWGASPEKVDYGRLYQYREVVLRKAFKAFYEKKGFDGEAFSSFYEQNSFWLDDYSLFMAIKGAQKGKSWEDWPESFKMREGTALEEARQSLEAEIHFQKFMQFEAFRQWLCLKTYANKAGLKIIGDMPIYAALDSADAWAQSESFQLDEKRRPIAVAGCPPDSFAAGGQLWGNPLYNWDYMEAQGFRWWKARLKLSFSLFDVVRIDHFRGFESYFSIPAGSADARPGHWVKGPGKAFIKAIHESFGKDAPVIAEDLGFLTPAVRELLAESGFPGMKVLQFAFDTRDNNGSYMPWTYPPNSVAYTGTHDNPGTAEWFKTAQAEDVQMALDYFGFSSDDGDSGKTNVRRAHAFIRAVFTSPANTAIIPLQDWLGLDRGRINTPSTRDGNWEWRMKLDSLSPRLAAKIARLTEITDRAS